MSKIKPAIVKVVKDGWNSLISGLGEVAFDKVANTDVTYEPLVEQDQEELYSGDDIAARIVDELPEEAFREGFDITAADLKENEALQEAIKTDRERLQLDARLEQAWKWARLYGGAGIVVVTERLQDMALPMDAGNIGEIKALQVLHRWELIWNELELDFRSPNFGHPKSYRIQPRALATTGIVSVVVHASRVIRFDGSHLPRLKFVVNQYWHDSVLTRTKPAIKKYNISHDAVASALQDWSVFTYKMKGLAEMIASGESNAVLTRMQTVQMAKSISRAIIIDADNEDATFQNRSMAGVPDSVKLMSNRLVSASKMPHTKILGESPDGSNATGNSTTSQWYDYVKSQQTNYLKPKALAILNLMFAARRGPTKGMPLKKLDLFFRPLWQMDEAEQATMHNNQAQADAAYIDRGVLDPNEVAKSRFGSGKYSMETEIDLDAREVPPMVGANAQEADEQKAEEDKAHELALAKAGGQDPAKQLPSPKLQKDAITEEEEGEEGDVAVEDDEDEDWEEILGHLFDSARAAQGTDAEIAAIKSQMMASMKDRSRK